MMIYGIYNVSTGLWLEDRREILINYSHKSIVEAHISNLKQKGWSDKLEPRAFWTGSDPLPAATLPTGQYVGS